MRSSSNVQAKSCCKCRTCLNHAFWTRDISIKGWLQTITLLPCRMHSCSAKSSAQAVKARGFFVICTRSIYQKHSEQEVYWQGNGILLSEQFIGRSVGKCIGRSGGYNIITIVTFCNTEIIPDHTLVPGTTLTSRRPPLSCLTAS